MGIDPDQLQREGVVGDLCSSLLDEKGKVVQNDRIDRITVITPGKLQGLHWRKKEKRPVIAVAGGKDKINAIKAVLLGESTRGPKPYISHLVTDHTVAKALLQL
jgi:DNA-binding transcriptional regulator LsrR (DeoR family)